MGSAFQFFFAMIVVLALIGAAFWLVRRFGGSRIGASAKGGRLPRLAVIDATPVDNRRRLVLVRRDNIEHLLMIGGPTDIVVEPNIVRAVPARDAARGPSLPDPASWADNDPPRPESLDYNDPPVAEPPPPRPARPSFVEEARRPPTMPMPERRERPVDRGGDMGGFTPEAIARPAPELRPEPPVRARNEQIARNEPMMPRPVARPAEPPKAPPVRAERPVAAPLAPAAPAVAAPAASSADQNLAEMAQRLEAALRQPGRDPRPSPPVAPETPPARPARAAPEVKIDSPMATSSAPPVAPPKATFEDLEEEMASLLGRPKPPA